MSLDQFMLWRFRMFEGVLDGIKSWNLNECVFNDGSKITYDVKNELITIETPKKSIVTRKMRNILKPSLIADQFVVTKISPARSTSDSVPAIRPAANLFFIMI